MEAVAELKREQILLERQEKELQFVHINVSENTLIFQDLIGDERPSRNPYDCDLMFHTSILL